MKNHIKNFLIELFESDASQDSASKPKLVFLIGPPAVGKSTYIKNNLQGYIVINRDDLVEKIAKETGVGTYDDMFARPPAELKNLAGVPPDKETLLAYTSNSEARNQVDAYIDKIKKISMTVSPSEKYGNIKSFDLKNLEEVIVKFGVKPEFINPFMWEKIEAANEKVGEELSYNRTVAVKQRKNFVIDMVNMGNDRNGHRRDILKILDEPVDDLLKLNQYYDQIAIVFAPKEGYTPEIISQIKKVAEFRQAEIKASGGAKTIPPQAYDRMFAGYIPPTTEEGFSSIEYVGIPSLEKLNNTNIGTLQESFFNISRWKILANLN